MSDAGPGQRDEELASIVEAAGAGLARLHALEGRKCVVVGGAGDLGAAASLGLAAAGAQVIVASRKLQRCAAVCAAGQSLAGRLEPMRVDVTVRAEIDELMESAVARLGYLDVVVNAMGTNVRRPAAEVAEGEWDQVMDTNLKGLFFSCQAAFKAMRQRGSGRIINISSAAGLAARAWPTTSTYGTSKGGVVHLTKYLAAEWATTGITVNSLAPGYFLTALTRPLMSQEGALDRLMTSVPMGRLGRIEEFVGPLLFLASDASSFITGQTLAVDGGRVVI
jgi:2-deoxy-D-gluconate 3-dehydrogenase